MNTVYIGPPNQKFNGIVAVSQKGKEGLWLSMENTKSKDFKEFIEDILERLQGDNHNEKAEVLFIFDNAWIHVSEETKILFKD